MLKILENVEKPLTRKERQRALFRAAHAQNFFVQYDFRTDGLNQKTSKAPVEKDFWLTTINAEWRKSGAAVKDVGISIFRGNTGQTVYNYLRNEPLVIQQVAFNSFPTALSPEGIKQLEIAPFLIPQGDNLTVSVDRLDTPNAALVDDVFVCCGGYYTLPSAYLTTDSTRGINESIELPVRHEVWDSDDIDLAGDGLKEYAFTNDRFARLVLAFAIIPDTPDSTTRQAQLQITDTYRGIKFCQDYTKWRFLAYDPTSARNRQQMWYWLPIEHFWNPFAPLKFSLLLDSGAPAQSYRILMLTRTV